MKWASGVEGGVMLDIRWTTRRSRAALFHKRGSLDVLCPIFSPLTPFFWVVNGIVTKLAACISLAVAVDKKTLRLQLNVLSSRRNEMISDLDSVYSPARRRKK